MQLKKWGGREDYKSKINFNINKLFGLYMHYIIYTHIIYTCLQMKDFNTLRKVQY